MANVHYLKTLSPIFQKAKNGMQEFEVENDSDYEVGDTLIFEELDSIKKMCTGAWAPKLIISKHNDDSKKVIILGLQEIKF